MRRGRDTHMWSWREIAYNDKQTEDDNYMSVIK